jgi:hypothetical protein
MFVRRIIVSACALSLAVPAAAGARPGFDPPAAAKAPVVYGDTTYDLQNQQELKAVAVKGVAGDTKGDLKTPLAAGKTVGHVDARTAQQFASSGAIKGGPAPSVVDRIGALSAKQLAAAYGTSRPTGTPLATASSSSPDNGTNGWRIAAVAEAGLLAAFVAGCGMALSRLRPRRRTAGLGI